MPIEENEVTVKELKIGIDLDDTFWDLLVAWMQRYNQLSGDNLEASDIRAWDVAQLVKDGWSKKVYQILEESELWEIVKPKPDSISIMKRLIKDGHEIYLVTATPYQTAHMKMRRFFELCPFMKEEQIIIAYKKQLIDVDILVDDYPGNLIGGNYHKLLFDAPHNWDYDEHLINAKRCHDWTDVYREINKIVMNRKGGIR